MQTFAGLALDTKRRGKGEEALAPSQGGLNIQHLLDAFLVLNIFHLLGLVALGALDRRRKAAKTLIANMPISPAERISDEDEDEQADPSNNAEGSIQLPMSAREGPFPSASSPDPRIPLLISSVERSQHVDDPTEPRPASSPISMNDPSRSKQARRGEIFAGLCAALIIFAWVLFLVTAWLRLRSKEERGASAY